MKRLVKLSCLIAVVVLSGCATRKQQVYLADMSPEREYPVAQKYEMVIQRDDQLSIQVNSKDPELAMAFNLPTGSSYSVGNDGSISVEKGAQSDVNGYTVDVNGDIDFPVLGKLHVEGLSVNQLRDMIKKRLIEGKLLNDPVVLVNIINFKYAVLGEVNSVGNFNVPAGNRVTLLQAIAQAGDLTDYARIDSVAVIREYGNKRRIIWNDLRSKDVFLSPAYYLQQNDIVYVQPNGRKAKQENRENMSLWTWGVSAVTTVMSLIFMFAK